MAGSRFVSIVAALAGLVIAPLAPAGRAQDAGAQAFLQSVYAPYEKRDKSNGQAESLVAVLSKNN